MFLLSMNILLLRNISNGGGVLVDSNSLADMLALEDATPIIDSLQGLQYLDSFYRNFEADPNFLTYNEAYFVKECKNAYKWVNMLDEKEGSNYKEEDETIQTIWKPGRGRGRDRDRPKEVNTKCSKVKVSKKL